MRIEDKNLEFSDNFSIKGEWHSAKIPEKKCAGILNYDKEIELELLAHHEEMEWEESDPETGQIVDYLKVFGEGESNVTLLKAFVTHHSNLSNSFGTKKITAQEMIIGSLYKEQKVDTIRFTYSDFTWGPFDGLKLIKQEGEQFKDPIKIHLEVQIDENTKFIIGEFAGLKSHSHFQITEKAYQFFRIDFGVAVDLSEATQFLEIINHFMRFCTRFSLYPNSVKILFREENKSSHYFPYWHSKGKPHRSLFAKLGYDMVKDDINSIILKWNAFWLANKDTVRDFFNLQESSATLESKFTETCNILQRFYSQNFSDDSNSFKEKLISFIEFCPNIVKEKIEQDDFLERVIDTRDYNVHGAGGRPKPKRITDLQFLFTAFYRIITLIEMFLLTKIGISDNERKIQFEKCFIPF